MASLETPVLDPRNERALVEQALVRVFNASGGNINDFSSSSVARALIEGLGFSAAELLYYVNQLPLALAIEFLKNADVVRSEGTAAIASITFNLTAPIGVPFTIPAGFVVTDSTGTVTYETDAQLIIPAGGTTGTVTATCTTLGTAGNLPAYRINRFIQPLAFLASCINTEPASGGTNTETQESAIARGLVAIKRRNIVTKDDYEQEAETVLGEGSRAYAIGLLSGDKVSYELGAVHLFLLNQSGDAANSAQLSVVQSTLSPRIQIGTALYCSSMDLLNVDVDIVARLAEGQDPNTVAETLWAALQDYLAPTKFEPGASVILKEVEYFLRLAGGVAYVQAVTLNGATTNLPMPYPYSLPKAHSLFCSLVDAVGETYQILLGAGEDYV